MWGSITGSGLDGLADWDRRWVIFSAAYLAVRELGKLGHPIATSTVWQILSLARASEQQRWALALGFCGRAHHASAVALAGAGRARLPMRNTRYPNARNKTGNGSASRLVS